MKKTISLMISAVMLLSVFSLSVFAEDECPHENTSWVQIDFGCACYCDDCGTKLADEQEHDWQIEELQEAECEEPGVGQNVCSRCEASGSIVETEPALGHDYVNGICSRCEEPEMPEEPEQPETAPEIVKFEGTAGENATWKYDPETVTLTFSGTGRLNTNMQRVLAEMFDTENIFGLIPGLDENGYWGMFDNKLRVVFEEGITGFADGLGYIDGELAFFLAVSYQFPKTLEDLPAAAFMSGGHVNEIRFKEGIKAIPEMAFYNCSCENTYIPKSVTSFPIDAFFCAYMDGEYVASPVIHYAGTEEEWNKNDFSCPGKVQTIDEETLKLCEDDFSHYTIVFEPAAELVVENEDVTVSGEIKEGTAEIEDIELKNTEEKADIVLDFSSEEDVKSVKLSSAAIDSVSENVKDKLAIQLKNADIVMDSKTVAALAGAESAGGVELIVNELKNDDLTKQQLEAVGKKSVDKILNFDIVADNGNIHEFGGGKVTVSFPFECKDTMDYTVCYLGNDGKIDAMPTRVENGKIVFETSHFSTFVLLSEAKGTNPNTGDSFPTWSIIALCVSIAGMAIILKKRHSFVG